MRIPLAEMGEAHDTWQDAARQKLKPWRDRLVHELGGTMPEPAPRAINLRSRHTRSSAAARWACSHFAFASCAAVVAVASRASASARATEDEMADMEG